MENTMCWLPLLKRVIVLLSAGLAAGCASPPQADPSQVELSCAQHCSVTLATCSSGFKFFPIVVQKQCNDNYDVCIKGCPPRVAVVQAIQNSPSAKLEELNQMLKKGLISQKDYDVKKAEILKSM